MAQMTADQLRKNIFSTYFTLRLGIVVLASVLPVILGVGGKLWGGVETLGASMSAYYGEHGGTMRNWLLGILWTIGAFLYLYKGFSTRENILLNIAGGCAVVLAMVPCDCWSDFKGTSNRVHNIAAAAFFVSMAAVCFFCATDTINLIKDVKRRNRFKKQYRAIGVVLLVVPVAAAIVSSRDLKTYVFFFEAFGVWTFGYYWLTKSREFRFTAAELSAVHGQLENVPGRGVVPAAAPAPTPAAVEER
jgi:hypothetical protein